MSATPKLMIGKRNTTYFVKNHEILLNYFNDLEKHTPWKHAFSCVCEDRISHFAQPATA